MLMGLMRPLRALQNPHEKIIILKPCFSLVTFPYKKHGFQSLFFHMFSGLCRWSDKAFKGLIKALRALSRGRPGEGQEGPGTGLIRPLRAL